MADDVIKKALEEIGLQTLVNRFQDERIDCNVALTLSDVELKRLGVDTIGDKYRLFNSIKKLQLSDVNEREPVQELAYNLQRERARLFGLGSSRSSGRRSRSSSATGPDNKRKKSKRGWMLQFFCLSSVNKENIPTSSEKEILNKADLGLKKITLFQGETESEVADRLMSEEEFPKLKEAGGFELLRCHPSSRTLTLISCKWNADDLKKNINPQANVYIRPIQKNLSTEPINTQDESEETSYAIKCMKCSKEFSARSLRQHVMDGCNEDVSRQQLEGIDRQEVENIIIVHEVHSTELTAQIYVNNEEIQQQLVTDPRDHTEPEQQSNVSVSESFVESDDLPNLIHTPREQRHEIVVEESTNVLGLSSSKIVLPEIQEVAGVIIKFCKENNIVDPVEILRKLQLEMVTGRPLEVEDVSQCVEGDTNFVMVDRFNLLQTARDEIESLTNLRLTLEIQFYNEVAVDYGGPRKEFFRLSMHEIKEKYFDNGLRELLADHYIFVGKLFALSIVQNGTLPAFIEPAIVQELFDSETNSSCIRNIQIGMDALGLYTICKVLPSLVFLFQSKKPALTMKSLTHLLQPQFSEEGSNANSFEKNVYAAFLRYLRNVASGSRNPMTLKKVLQFTTGTTEEPILGFKIHPCIEFSDVETSFLPTANTCICSLRIPRPSPNARLPVDGDLFQIYDYAFTSDFYGLK